MFSNASPYSDFVDAQFLFIVILSSIVLLGLMFAMILFVIRYRRNKHPHSSNIEGNTTLEVLWTVIPLGLFMYMFYLGWAGYQKISTIPENAIPIKVTARMWSWSFEYPDGIKTDTLYVPINTAMKLILHSIDVNHSLFIPAFRVKKDVIPNRENTMWFKTPRIASYDIACAEYCGLHHSNMYTKIVVKDSVSFENWYRDESVKQSKAYKPMLTLSQMNDSSKETTN